MVIEGRVENGVVMLPPGSPFREGQLVTVTAQATTNLKDHSILNIPTFSVGKILDEEPDAADILGEMLEGRKI